MTIQLVLMCLLAVWLLCGEFLLAFIMEGRLYNIVELGPNETKADQDPAAPKRADATTGVGAADGVECVIDTRRFHATRKAINRTRAIVDGGGAERTDLLQRRHRDLPPREDLAGVALGREPE